MIRNVEFEETAERLKVVMPLQRQWGFYITYSIILFVWVLVTGIMLGILLRTPLSGLSTLFVVVFIVIVLVWAYLWYRLGKSVWRWWQFYAATREVVFLDGHTLIVRRPLSLLGVTDAYDMRHVGPFYYQEKYGAIAFDYGSRGGLFGTGLARPEAEALIGVLNGRFFKGVERVSEEW